MVSITFCKACYLLSPQSKRLSTWLIVLIFQLISPLSAHAQNFVQADELIVTIPAQAHPYYSVNENNQPQGFAIEVFEAVAARAGLRYRYEIKQDWNAVLQGFQQGLGDIIPNVEMSNERSLYLNFTAPITTSQVGIFVLESNQSIQSSDGLANHKVALVPGSQAGSLIKNRPDIITIEFDKIELAFYELISGKVDALVFAEPAVWYIAHNLGLGHKIKVLKPGLIQVDHAIGVRKDLTAIRDQLDIALQALLQSDQYQQIYKKWFVYDKPFWDVTKVFWLMALLLIMVVIVFLFLRHRELVALNASLQQQIDQATHELSESNAHLQDLTVTDTLTGILNRRAFEHNLEELIGRAERYTEHFSMLIFDIDDFKVINDQYGHVVGDTILKDLVERIQAIVRDVDILCRWGGEEFTVLMPRTSQQGAIKMAERCRAVIANSQFDQVGFVTISLGVTCFQEGDTERELFKRADDALYQAKEEGKNRVVWHGGIC